MIEKARDIDKSNINIYEYYSTNIIDDPIFTSTLLLSLLYLIFEGAKKYSEETSNRQQAPQIDAIENPEAPGSRQEITNRFFSEREISAASKWYRGRIIYVSIMISIFILSIPLFPQLLSALLPDSPFANLPNSFAPLLAALCVGGFFPNFPGINQLELLIRQFAHKQAGVPEDINFLKNKLLLNPVNWNALSAAKSSDNQLTISESFENNHDKSISSYSDAIRSVQKLKLEAPYFFEIKNRLQKALYYHNIIKKNPFHPNAIENDIVERFNTLSENNQFRLEWVEKQLASNIGENERKKINKELETTLRSICYLLALNILTQTKKLEKIDVITSEYFIYQGDKSELPYSFSNQIIYSFLISGICLFFYALVFQLIAQVSIWDAYYTYQYNEVASEKRRWVLSPSSIKDAFTVAIQIAIPSITAIAIYMKIRQRKARDNAWYFSNIQPKDASIKYVSPKSILFALTISYLAIALLQILFMTPLTIFLDGKPAPNIFGVDYFAKTIGSSSNLFILLKPCLPAMIFTLIFARMVENIIKNMARSNSTIISIEEILCNSTVISIIISIISISIMMNLLNEENIIFSKPPPMLPTKEKISPLTIIHAQSLDLFWIFSMNFLFFSGTILNVRNSLNQPKGYNTRPA
ncbi:hypothetical protein [Roseibium album]|uniref:Uncharacterized protein n=1 Tax=Roseibium album TaxID=311410 RepID=A0A0M7APP6_9HYPH|nr:hypothetical protein [Roseibium album]CTQ59899.1 hypothetical protein LA5094_02669 [Roseibium album]CTQ76677.1 hypothetical protein LA5095_03728 [Roseibium album]CTQ77108.1 hypothetical protein LA5096_05010 [Roseibium album]